MGFINFVIAILCWSCCRFVETTCMFLYMTVVQRTGSELEVVWFLVSDCISNQAALTTDLLSETDQTSPTETKTNTVIGSIHQCGRHISEVIHTGWRSSWQPYTYKKKNCEPRKKSLLRQSECSELIFVFKEGYKVGHTSAPWLSSAWTANKRKDGSILSWCCCSPSDSRCKHCPFILWLWQ